MRFSWLVTACAAAGFLLASSAAGQENLARMLPANPDWQSVTPADAVLGCDQYASHPMDPLKPANVAGVASEAEVASDAAYIYCNRALYGNEENPRILFQWGRVNLAREPRMTGQPRQMFTLAYRNGSEIAGIYLAQLPPEPTTEQLRQQFRESIGSWESYAGNRQSGSIVGTPAADELLMGSIVTIYSAALLRILSGEADYSDQECSGGHMLDVATHEILCNGLVVGQY